MKMKNALIFLFFSGLLINQAKALYVVTISYHNSCFLGCGVVDYSSTPTTINLVTGSSVTFWAEYICCTGIGFKVCPRKHTGFKEVSTVSEQEREWIGNVSLDMWQQAIDKIDAGDLSGTKEITVHNLELDIKMKVKTTWIKYQNDEGEWEENIEVAVDKHAGDYLKGSPTLPPSTIGIGEIEP